MRFVSAILLLSASVFAAPAPTPNPGSIPLAPDLQQIVKRKTLRISLHSEDSFPFYYVNEQKELTGTDIWLGKQIAEKLGVNLEWIREGKTFEEVIKLVVTRRADISVSALFPTLERAKSVRFTDAYWNVKPILVLNRVKNGMSRDSSLVALKNLAKTNFPIGLYHAGFLSMRAEHRYPNANLRYYRSRKELLPALKSGEITAAFIDEIELQKWREKMPEFDLYFRSVEDTTGPLAISIAVHPEDLQLHYWLNTFLGALTSDGKMESLINEAKQLRRTVVTGAAK